MSTTTDAAPAIASIEDAVDVLEAANTVLIETLASSVIENRPEVAEMREALLGVRDFLVGRAK